MAIDTKIEWCDHTFNPWVGCTKISPACDHCYAESWAKRSGSVEWGNHPRKRTSEAYWRQPLKWNRIAERDGIRRKVFCASLADVFDNQVDPQWRADLWALIKLTPALDWLLLTKRPQNARQMMIDARNSASIDLVSDEDARWMWPNIWLGTTVENQAEADKRIPQLLDVPAEVHFLSCEPLLGSVDLTKIAAPKYVREDEDGGWTFNAMTSGDYYAYRDDLGYWEGGDGPQREHRIGWVIAGGESGPHSRPSHPDWFHSLQKQCASGDIPFFFKQWGDWAPVSLNNDPGGPHHDWMDGTPWMRRAGKRTTGHLLRGAECRAFPK